MICSRCGSDRSFQFEVDQASPARPPAAELPLVCRSCGLISIGGEPVDLPDVLAKPICELAEKAAVYGKKGLEELEELAKADPDARVEGYMANYYKAAYLDGFFRALAFFQHQAKEGRLVRLRAIWKDCSVSQSRSYHDVYDQVEDQWSGHPAKRIMGPIMVTVQMSETQYTEFDRLLHLSIVPETADASSPSNEQAPLPKGHS